MNRPPVVAVLGHIDHGKSSLLDYIRQTKLAEKEVGGITQALGAYEAEHQGRPLTFLDTPGHEAFANLRGRSAKIADLAILVVSAEEGVKPQTKEALQTILEANLPYAVALTKSDRPNADPERVSRELTEIGTLVESLGGPVPAVATSTKTGEGVTELLDLLLLLADLQNLTSDAGKPGQGYVLETAVSKRTGITTTLIIKDGTLARGQYLAAGKSAGKVKSLKNFLGADEQAIGPGRVAVVTGWDNEPETGDAWQSGTAKIDSEKPATSPAGRAPAAADAEENLVPIVIKSDTAGRAEAVRHKLADLKVEGVNFKILAAGAGEISDADIKLAGATPGALVVGFGVSAGAAVSDLAERRGVTLASFPLIYELLDWLTAELKKRSQSKSGPVKIGSGRLLKIFSVKKERQVVGGEVAEGVIRAGQRLKITRRDNELGLARVVELQQQKTAAREVEAGKQFGALLESKIGLAAGDQWELFESSD